MRRLAYQVLPPFIDCPLSAIEFEDNKLLLQYWKSKRGEKFAPRWSDVELLDLPPSYIPQILVADVLSDGADFTYRFFGSWHADCHKRDMTGWKVSDYSDKTYAAEVVAGYRAVVEKKEPLAFHYDMILEHIPYSGELIRLPLSNDGSNVTAVLVGESFVHRAN